MATINIAQPQVTTAGGPYNSQPAIQGFLAASHIKEGDVVILNGNNTIQTAATNPAAALLGIAVHDSLETWGGSIQATPALNQVFGWSQVNTPLFPADPATTLIALFTSGGSIEINLASTVGWISGGTTQAVIGTNVGLTIDGPSGYWVVDPAQSNAIATITDRIEGPGFSSYGTGAGDIAARVVIKVHASATAFGA